METNQPAGPYSIGSDYWPGLSKLMEELGELAQVVGKIVGAGGMVEHWDGTNLLDRLHEEMADVLGACDFVVYANKMDRLRIINRQVVKDHQFRAWHEEHEKHKGIGPLSPLCCREAVPSAASCKEGTGWTCPACGRDWVMIEDEAEGAAWWPFELRKL